MSERIASEEADNGEESGSVYPEYWWDERQRREVESKISGAVGYVYRGFERPVNPTMRTADQKMREKKRKGRTIIRKYLLALLLISFFAAPYIIISTLTRWNSGNSTPLQRALIMLWIVNSNIGVLLAVVVTLLQQVVASAPRRMCRIAFPLVLLLATAVIYVPAVGGMYMAANLILGDRTCTRL
ncbi:uncharacterized protein H6S33_007113 [Morchella sextelata]|uniref:uncharacterized protein n=1 Tax=Morchella sextelata TaxID=1174677 RepID=UPI001D0458DE|nr:uncharacterized protein H6S33_007113 [Morchella sextelata]KAH0604082.1 hypothetical protein H6S33_007113 [Morchella sextelata]